MPLRLYLAALGLNHHKPVPFMECKVIDLEMSACGLECVEVKEMQRPLQDRLFILAVIFAPFTAWINLELFTMLFPGTFAGSRREEIPADVLPQFFASSSSSIQTSPNFRITLDLCMIGTRDLKSSRDIISCPSFV